jgi:hypothetical protein
MDSRNNTRLIIERVLIVTLVSFLITINGEITTVIAGDPEFVTADDAPPEAASKPPFVLSDTKRIESGKKQFNQTCAAWCHGKDPVLFVDREGLDEKFVYTTIRDGGGW